MTAARNYPRVALVGELSHGHKECAACTLPALHGVMIELSHMTKEDRTYPACSRCSALAQSDVNAFLQRVHLKGKPGTGSGGAMRFPRGSEPK